MAARFAEINIDEAQARIQSPTIMRVVRQVSEIGVQVVAGNIANYAGNGPDLARWPAARLNGDGDLRLSYLAGWGINSDSKYVVSPKYALSDSAEGIFTGSPRYVTERDVGAHELS